LAHYFTAKIGMLEAENYLTLLVWRGAVIASGE